MYLRIQRISPAMALMADEAMGIMYMSQVGLSSEKVVGRPILLPTALSMSI